MAHEKCEAWCSSLKRFSLLMPIAATSERLRTYNETLPRCKNGQLRLLQVGVEAVVALTSAALGYALESNWAYIQA